MDDTALRNPQLYTNTLLLIDEGIADGTKKRDCAATNCFREFRVAQQHDPGSPWTDETELTHFLSWMNTQVATRGPVSQAPKFRFVLTTASKYISVVVRYFRNWWACTWTWRVSGS